MDYSTFFLLLSFLSSFIYVFTISSHRNSRLPPGPYPFPIIGNLLTLGTKPHHSLAALSKRYGPLMSLKLGSRTTVVVSSPNMAKEFFQKHDQSFSNRSLPDTVRVMDHHKYSIVWLPAGDEWRKLRRIAKEYLFSGQCLDASEQLRMDKVQELLDHVTRCCTNKKTVNIGAAAFTTSLNILTNLLFSKDLSHYDSTSSQEFKDVIWSALESGGKPNLVDFFPFLKPFDPQGLSRQAYDIANKLFSIFDKIINQRLQTRASLPSTKNDLLDMLLDLNFEDEKEFSLNDMKHLFADLFIAGTDSSSTTLEWAMSELIRNPEKMETCQIELNKLTTHINNKTLQEHDISQLPYLQAVIKETLRLHPPVPFLIPHEAIHDVEIQDFIIPKNAQILCNVWAMGRDPKVWADPERFKPERFLGTEIDYRGQDFNLIPFGAGRRMCPGMNLGHRMLHIILGSLIQKFDWNLEGNVRAQDLDMYEKFGITVPRNVPLMAVPSGRE